jgi:hypothetical protein
MGPPPRREEGSDYSWSLPFYSRVTLLVLILTHSLTSAYYQTDSDSESESLYDWWFTQISSNSVGLMTIFYCLRFKTPPTWRARSPYLYPPKTGCPSYIPRHCVPFSSPLTTHRATMEVFNLLSDKV